MITQEQKNRINDLSLELKLALVASGEYSESQAVDAVKAVLANYEEDIKWGETGMMERDMKIYIKYGL